MPWSRAGGWSPAVAELGDPGHRRRVLGTVGLALAQDGRPDEATEVLSGLRSCVAGDATLGAGPAGVRSVLGWDACGRGGAARVEDAACALIEGNIALHRGDRELAAEWFAAAVDAGAGGRHRRDVVEALVGLAASVGDAEVLDRLDRVCRESGIQSAAPGGRASSARPAVGLRPRSRTLRSGGKMTRKVARGVARAKKPPWCYPSLDRSRRHPPVLPRSEHSSHHRCGCFVRSARIATAGSTDSAGLSAGVTAGAADRRSASAASAGRISRRSDQQPAGRPAPRVRVGAAGGRPRVHGVAYPPQAVEEGVQRVGAELAGEPLLDDPQVPGQGLVQPFQAGAR